MTFNEYQKLIGGFAKYPNIGNNITYPALGLCGEAGEVAEKIKKVIRDKEGVVDSDTRDALAKEIGDVLWYAARLSAELGLTFDDVAQGNIDKLNARLARGTINGSGDNR